jgi:hypothetical protein
LALINAYGKPRSKPDHDWNFIGHLGDEWLTRYRYTNYTKEHARSVGYARLIWEASNTPPVKTKSLGDKGAVYVHPDYDQRLATWRGSRDNYLRDYALKEHGLSPAPIEVEEDEPLTAYRDSVLGPQTTPKRRGMGKRFSKTYQPRWSKT